MHATWNCARCFAHGERDLDMKHLAMAWVDICREHREKSPGCSRTDQIQLYFAPVPAPVKHEEVINEL